MNHFIVFCVHVGRSKGLVELFISHTASAEQCCMRNKALSMQLGFLTVLWPTVLYEKKKTARLTNIVQTSQLKKLPGVRFLISGSEFRLSWFEMCRLSQPYGPF